VCLWGSRSCVTTRCELRQLLEDSFGHSRAELFHRLKRNRFNPTKTSAGRNRSPRQDTALLVGRPLDVLGFEQAVPLFNDFNYRPRPVFQSYSGLYAYLNAV